MIRTGGGRVAAPEVESIDAITTRIRGIAHPLESPKHLDPLMDLVGDSRFVLLGEASHGTSDYYTWRAQISQRLIREKGFSFIAVEGDWPDCYSVNRYIKGYPGSGTNAREVLHQFNRWPTWMWANWEIVALTEWLRRHNSTIPKDEKVGFYGLDVYSLWNSMREIIDYLKENHPESVEAAKEAIRCFEPYGEDVQQYAVATAFVPKSCEADVIRLLREVRSRLHYYPDDDESAFATEQNALVAVNAERYYRSMIQGDTESWNIRDYHMADTLDRLMRFHGPTAKAIVWEHNTHIGDARATDMADEGMVNVGQITRERHLGDGVVLVGFGGYEGSVIAGRAWDAPMEKMPVPQAEEGTWEDLLHHASAENKMLIMEDIEDQPEFFERRGHRAIGVVYRPEFERYGNYVPTVLPRRYDAFMYIDQTKALHPLHIEPIRTEEPETYPWGI